MIFQLSVNFEIARSYGDIDLKKSLNTEDDIGEPQQHAPHHADLYGYFTDRNVEI
jgi:hypothetical protein